MTILAGGGGGAAYVAGLLPLAASAPQPALLPVGDLSTPVVDGQRLSGTIKASLVLVATDEAAAARLEARQPLVRARLRSALDGYGRTILPMQPFDTRRLGASLARDLRADFPDVKSVLVQRAEYHPG